MFGIFATLIGASMTASAQREQGRAAKRQAEYNAKLQDNKALAIEYARKAETRRMQASAQRMQAKQRALYSKTGAVITGDTPLLVMLEQAGDIQMDIMNARRNSLIEQQRAKAGAEMTRYEGEMAKRSAYKAASNTILGGVLKAGTMAFDPDFSFNDPMSGYEDLGFLDTMQGNMPYNV